MPTRGSVTVETLTALIENTEGHHLVLRTENRLPVDVARNRLATAAIGLASDRSLFADVDPIVVWIDSDAFFLEGTLTVLTRELDRGEFDLIAPLSGARVPGSSIQALRDASALTSSPQPGVDCRAGDLVPVELITHFMVHRASLLQRIGNEPFGAHDNLRETDDFHFCRRVREVGGRIAVHTGVPVFHVDERNGAAFLPGFDAVRVVGNRIDPHAEVNALDREQRSYGARIDAQLARGADSQGTA